jgi:hypothetical protein
VMCWDTISATGSNIEGGSAGREGDGEKGECCAHGTCPYTNDGQKCYSLPLRYWLCYAMRCIVLYISI